MAQPPSSVCWSFSLAHPHTLWAPQRPPSRFLQRSKGLPGSSPPNLQREEPRTFSKEDAYLCEFTLKDGWEDVGVYERMRLYSWNFQSREKLSEFRARCWQALVCVADPFAYLLAGWRGGQLKYLSLSEAMRRD